MKAVIGILWVALGVIIMYAAVNKGLRFEEWVHDVDVTTRSLPWVNPNFVAGGVIVTEAIVGLLLIFRIKPMASLPAFFLLISFYCGIIVSFWHRQGSFQCGCFGPSLQRTDFGWLLTRNGLLVAAAVVVYLFEKSALSKRQAPEVELAR